MPVDLMWLLHIDMFRIGGGHYEVHGVLDEKSLTVRRCVSADHDSGHFFESNIEPLEEFITRAVRLIDERFAVTDAEAFEHRVREWMRE